SAPTATPASTPYATRHAPAGTGPHRSPRVTPASPHHQDRPQPTGSRSAPATSRGLQPAIRPVAPDKLGRLRVGGRGAGEGAGARDLWRGSFVTRRRLVDRDGTRPGRRSRALDSETVAVFIYTSTTLACNHVQ